MQFGPESLLPPLIAIVLAVLSRTVVFPLAAGVFTGALLLAYRNVDRGLLGAPVVFLEAMRESIFSTSHLQALAFSLLLGAMVGVIESAGGMRSLVHWLTRKIRSRRGAQTLIATSGLAIFFDDYANCLLIGGTMRSTADRYGISREKLAYLVDSTAAPVAGLAVVGTWSAIEISYMAEGLRAGGVDDPHAAFQLFLESIPFRFYSWLTLVLVFLVAWTGRDFGAMRWAESRSHQGKESDSETDGEFSDRVTAKRESGYLWMAAVLPVLICLAVVAGVLIVTGLNAVSSWNPGESWLRRAGEVIGNGNSYIALILGSLAGLSMAVALSLLLRGSDARGVVRASLLGAKQMMPALVILWFAWALSSMTDPDHLDTGGYLSRVLSDRLDVRLLPTVVFVLAGALAFSTGTSWGTMGILTPLSISLAIRLDPSGQPDSSLVLATCGSVLAGAIFGDHCSPISDTTVLSSQASGCNHLAHVRTQMPYALVVAAVCIGAGTVPAAFQVSPWISLVSGSLLLFALLRWLGKSPQETTL